MKLRRILNEVSNPTQKLKKIIITASDPSNSLEEFLKWWKQMGDIGHSASVYADVNEYSKSNPLTSASKFYCDGDGADRIKDINIEYIEE